jgi:hypothetical protein
MKMKYVLIGAVIGLLGVGAWYVTRKPVAPPQVHYHAEFQVYVNGVKQDFSADKYMDLTACRIGPETEVEKQLDKGHLHDNVGEVVHVHTNGAVWSDLFTNIKYPIDPSQGLETYINGIKVDNGLSQPIKPYDSLVVLIGPHGDIKPILQNQVTRAQIVAVEGTSESCGN